MRLGKCYIEAMLTVAREPEVIRADQRRTTQANLALARRLEREWHNLDKLMEELVAADKAGELQGYRRI